MVKQIVRDVFFLGQKSEPATKEDLQVGRDLQDTLRANRDRCVGMAANMIGVKKNIIIVNMGAVDIVMFNPVLVKGSGLYETEEGCRYQNGSYDIVFVFCDTDKKPYEQYIDIKRKINEFHGVSKAANGKNLYVSARIPCFPCAHIL